MSKKLLPTDEEEIDHFLDMILDEDIGRGDITTTLALPNSPQVTFIIQPREAMVLSGVTLVKRLLERFSDQIYISCEAEDGEEIDAGRPIIKGQGKAHIVFMLERVILNLLQHMSGIASFTHAFVNEVHGTTATIIDTRKTIPGLRLIQKMAVIDGGGRNHRMRLDDGVLLKDNHLSALNEPIKATLERIRESLPLLTAIEVECESIDAVKEALKAGADIIMLDNMSIHEMTEAVRIVEGKVPLEASGNISLQNVKEVAMTGVDYISIGKLTHSAPAKDIGLDVIG